jgi:ribonucleoside-diphosphate reductase alpha chain
MKITKLAEKVMLDRYSLKDVLQSTLSPNDLVVVTTKGDGRTGYRRELANIIGMNGHKICVRTEDGKDLVVNKLDVDKPLELDYSEIARRVSNNMASNEVINGIDWYNNFEWLMGVNEKDIHNVPFVPAGRILTGAGTNQDVTLYNCYVLPHVPDDMRKIFIQLGNMAEIMRKGGGVGMCLSTLRPKKSRVAGSSSYSSGSVSWGGSFSYVTGLVMQHGTRMGALILLLDVWHPDIMEFINIKRDMTAITNANISICITNKFMEAVKNNAMWDLEFPDTTTDRYDLLWDGDLEEWKEKGLPVIKYNSIPAKDIWDAIAESAWACGEPGVWFRDKINARSNSYYYNKLVGCNPCVTGDTLVSTEHGYTKAKDLQVGMKIRTPKGLLPIEKIYMNGIQRIYKVKFSDGGELDATSDHKLKVVRDKKYEWVAISDLKEGDKVLVSPNESFGEQRNLPQEAIDRANKSDIKIPTHYDRHMGFLVGCVLGNGCLRKVKSRNSHSNQCYISFGRHDEQWFDMFKSIMDDMRIHTNKTIQKKEITQSDGTVVEHGAIRLDCYKLATLMVNVGMIPGIKAPKKALTEELLGLDKEFLAGVIDGLFSTDGSVNMKQDNPMVRFHTSSPELANQVRRILLQFGIHGRIYRTEKDPDNVQMYDGRSMYGTGQKFDVIIMNEGIARFYSEIGISHPKKGARLKELAENWYYIGGTWLASVISVKNTERDEEVYDVFEPNTLTWITNGYVSLDCSEQPLPAWGVCNLGSLNLPAYIHNGEIQWGKLVKAIRYAVRFLDNVVDVTKYLFDKNEGLQKAERRIGLGRMGLGEMLIRLGIKYGSVQALNFVDKLFKFITCEAYKASADLAVEKGPSWNYDSKLLESGFMCNMPSEILEYINKRGLRNIAVMSEAPTGSIGTMVNTSTGIEPFFAFNMDHGSNLGSHELSIDWVNDLRNNVGMLPPYCTTAMDISPSDHIAMLAACQRWTDSGVSKTINMPQSASIADVKRAYTTAYNMGCNSVTIYRDQSRDVQMLSACPECIQDGEYGSCELSLSLEKA